MTSKCYPMVGAENPKKINVQRLWGSIIVYLEKRFVSEVSVDYFIQIFHKIFTEKMLKILFSSFFGGAHTFEIILKHA